MNSTFTKAKLEKTFSAVTGQIFIVPPGVGDHFYEHPRTRSHRSADAPIRLVTAARLSSSAKKNVDNVLRGLAILHNELDFTYTVLGDGDLRPNLEKLAKELGIADQTEFLGNVANFEMPSYLDRADLFVLPSKESFGISYVEAAARGVPSLLSRSGGALDAVIEGTTGLIIDQHSPAGIAGGIKEFARTRANFRVDEIVGFSKRFRWSVIASDIRAHLLRAIQLHH